MNKKWLVIDAHTHYLPEEAVARASTTTREKANALLTGPRGIPWQRLRHIEESLRMMEDGGVDMGVLNLANWSEQGLEVSKALNDGYARINKEYPGKFILCGHVPLDGSQKVVDEIERCINVLGLKGIALVASFPDVNLDAPQLSPLYEKVCKLDVPIVIHPAARFPIWGGGEKYNLARTISREYDIAKGGIELMYGVMSKFPELKLLMPHYGGGLPGLKARLRAYYEPEGYKIPDNLKNGAKTPRELKELGVDKAFDKMFDKVYFDMAGGGTGWLPMIKAALLTIKTDRLCFGTDYPFDIHSAEDIKSFVDTVKGLDIPERDRRLILGENIKRLFKI